MRQVSDLSSAKRPLEPEPPERQSVRAIFGLIATERFHSWPPHGGVQDVGISECPPRLFAARRSRALPVARSLDANTVWGSFLLATLCVCRTTESRQPGGPVQVLVSAPSRMEQE